MKVIELRTKQQFLNLLYRDKVSFLGQGAYGVVYYIEELDKAVKLSTDRMEYQTAKYLKENPRETIVTIHDAYMFSERDKFRDIDPKYFTNINQNADDAREKVNTSIVMITMEKLIPLGDEYDLIKGTKNALLLHNALVYLTYGTDYIEQARQRSQMAFYEIVPFKKLPKKMQEFVVNARRDLLSLYINPEDADIHNQNVMLDSKGNFKLIDLMKY